MKLVMPLFCVATAALSTAPAPARAADWPIRSGDVPFAVEDLRALPGQSFIFFDDGEALFGEDGAYAYTYSAANGGGTAWGSYFIAEDGSICVDYGNGQRRCDLYVRNGSRVIVLTQSGERYPVR